VTTIEVMRKALEALKHSRSVLNHRDLALECVPVNAAITALRAEIERLEAVEPVVWGVTYHASGEPTDLFFSEDEARIEAENCGWTARVVPLYTAPIAPAIPAPTHEQIDEGWIQCGGSGSAYDAWHDGARWAYDLAAKRAHARVLGGRTIPQRVEKSCRTIGKQVENY